MSLGPILADAWRIAFLCAQAPVTGAVLLLAIAAVTGAHWPVLERPARGAPLVMVGAGLLGVAQLADPAPPHLAMWMHPLAVTTRGLTAGAGFWFAAARLRGAPSPTSAAILLAVYALLVTPLGFDWLLGQAPGHGVSAAGMMLVTAQVAAATALPLALGWGDRHWRRDMAKLMVAASLGLGYLMFMDYLIVWFGNLPSHVDFYVARRDGLLPALALLLGWAVPIVLMTKGGERRQRCAGAATLLALLLIQCWWIGGSAASGLLAAAMLLALGLVARAAMREAAHG